MSFTQSICEECWIKREGDRQPVRVRDTIEQCCLCGTPTNGGIFIRIDPATVPYPRLQDEADAAHRRDYSTIDLSRRVQALIRELRQTDRVRGTTLDSKLTDVEQELQKMRDHIVAVWD